MSDDDRSVTADLDSSVAEGQCTECVDIETEPLHAVAADLDSNAAEGLCTEPVDIVEAEPLPAEVSSVLLVLP